MAKEYNIAIIIGAKDKASAVLGGLGKGLTSLGKAAVGLGVGAAAGVGALGIGLTKLAIDAAPIEGIEKSFVSMVESMGKSSDEMLKALEEGSAGMVSQRDLMEKWNMGAQLISKDFAATLPDAMGYFTKIAASTGESVDYLMESYIRGTGRLSTVILDNLSIQVSQEEATQRAAKMFGVAAEDLSKYQLQMGMSNVVLEKLAENTAAMPDVVGSAAQQMAAFKVTLQNVKDQIGLAMLPALQGMMTLLGDLAKRYGPMVVKMAQQLGTWLGEKIPQFIEAVQSGLRGFQEEGLYIGLENFLDTLGITPPQELWTFLNKLLPLLRSVGETLISLPDQFSKIWSGLGGTVSGVSETILGAVDSIRAWFVENWPVIQGVFLTVWEVIKAAALTVADIFTNQVVPPLQQAFANLTEALGKLGIDWSDIWSALWEATKIVLYGIGAAILGIIAVITGIVTAIASVAEHVSAVLSDMADTFMKGLEAIAKIVGGVMAVIQGIIHGDLDLILAGVSAFGEGVLGLFTAMGEGILNAIRLTFGTVVNAVTTFISTVINFFTGLKDTLVGGSIIQDMMDSMLDIIQGKLSAILGVVTSFIADVIGAFSSLGDSLRSIGESIMEGLRAGIMSRVGSIIDSIRNAIGSIISEAEGALDIFSPSGVFMEIGKRMMEGMALGITQGAGMPAMAAVGAAGNVSSTTNHYYFYQTVHTRATADITVQSFESMRAMVG